MPTQRISTQKDKTRDMTKGAIAPTLFQLGLPRVFGIFFILFFILVDVYFISKLGDDALTAVSFTIPVISFIDSLTIGFGLAVTVIVSRAVGAGQVQEAHQRGIHGILITFSVVSLLCLAGWVAMKPLFSLIGATPDLMPMISSYMSWTFIGTALLTLPLVGNSIMRGSGNTMLPAIAMLLAAGINAVLDPILIFGLLGFPKLGMDGAAIATIIARLAGAGFVFYNLIHRFNITDALKKWKIGFVKSVREVLHTAIPAATANIVPPLTAFFLTSLMARYGDAAVSAYGVVTRVELLFFVPFFGASAALAPFVGQNWSANNIDRIKKAVKIIAMFNIVWGVTIAVMLGVFGQKIIELFTTDMETVGYGLIYFSIVPVCYLAVGLIQISSAYLNATRRPKHAMIIPMVQCGALIFPLALLGAHYYGAIAIFIAVCVGNVITGIGFFTAIYRRL